VRTLLQLAAAFALISIGVGAAVIARDTHRLLAHSDASLTKAETWGSSESQTVHSILLSAKNGAEIAADFSQEQREQLRKTSRDSDNLVRNSQVVLRNAEQLLYHTDQELNTELLPHLDSEIQSTSTAMQFSAESFTQAADALTFQLNDPAIGQTLDGLNLAAGSFATASGNFSKMTASGDSIMAHGDHVAAYWDKKLTTPMALWKSLLLTTLRVGSDSANIYAGFGR
jgi:hypothetical protein